MTPETFTLIAVAGSSACLGALAGLVLWHRLFIDDYVPRSTFEERAHRVHELALQRDRLVNLVDGLNTELLRMKRDGFVAARPAKVVEAPDIEREGLQRAEAQLIQRSEKLTFLRAYAARIVEKTGCSEADALREANDHWNAEHAEDPPT